LNAPLAQYIDELGQDSCRVSKVEVQSKRRDRVSVFVDEEFAFGLVDEVAARHGIRAGAVLNADTLLAVFTDEAKLACKRLAIRFISYRMRSEAEVRRRLRKEGADADVIAVVLEDLRRLELVDDRGFAEQFARDALTGKKWGPHRIRQALRRAGVRPGDIEPAVQALRHTIEDEDIVTAVAEKRWRQLARVADVKKRKKRLYDYLVRRGFDYEDVRRAVANVAG
jgi:regulatory protein